MEILSRTGTDECQQKTTPTAETQTMDVPTRLINDKTYVPLRFLSENSGYTVAWDEATGTTSIITE